MASWATFKNSPVTMPRSSFILPMMFGLGITEILVIAVIALIFIGPEQLPEVARTIARFLNDIKRSTSSLSEEFKSQMDMDFAERREEVYKEHLRQTIGDKELGLDKEANTELTSESEAPKTDQAQQDYHPDAPPLAHSHLLNLKHESPNEKDPLLAQVSPEADQKNSEKKSDSHD